MGTATVETPAGKLLVLVIDNSVGFTERYLQELRRHGFTVKYCYGMGDALDFFRQKDPSVVAIVLGLVMPSDKKYQHQDTQRSLSIEDFLDREVRHLYPNVPVVLVLTQVDLEECLNQFQENSHLKIVRKLDHSPLQLAQIVSQMIGHSNEIQGKKEEEKVVSPILTTNDIALQASNNALDRLIASLGNLITSVRESADDYKKMADLMEHER